MVSDAERLRDIWRMRAIGHQDIGNLVKAEAALVVEVLDRPYFRKFHLPGAVNIPINGNFDAGIRHHAPDRSRPVIVYCLDAACDASRRAAARLEALGYTRVYDYEGGKMDWKQAGLPTER
jgi:rhodanese-related sulfurtransferase